MMTFMLVDDGNTERASWSNIMERKRMERKWMEELSEAQKILFSFFSQKHYLAQHKVDGNINRSFHRMSWRKMSWIK